MAYEHWAALSDTSVLWYMPSCTSHQEVALFDLPSTVRTVGDDSHHTLHLPTMDCTLLGAAHSCGQSSSDCHTRELLNDFATAKNVPAWPGKCMMHPMTASTITLLCSKGNGCIGFWCWWLFLVPVGLIWLSFRKKMKILENLGGSWLHC